MRERFSDQQCTKPHQSVNKKKIRENKWIGPVSKSSVQLDNNLFFFRSNVTSLHICPQVVYPSQSAALPTPQQSYIIPFSSIFQSTQNNLNHHKHTHMSINNVYGKIYIPAFLGKFLHEPSPCCWMYCVNISSSSAVHLPFFNPTFSQHGALTIVLPYYYFFPNINIYIIIVLSSIYSLALIRVWCSLCRRKWHYSSMDDSALFTSVNFVYIY